MTEPKSDIISIKPEKNSELKVNSLADFKNSRGETIKTKKSMILCRCGQSSTKPYCDGTHKKVNFNDEKLDD